VGIALFGLLMLGLALYLFSAIDRSSIYPPGMDPVDIFKEQIRAFWPD